MNRNYINIGIGLAALSCGIIINQTLNLLVAFAETIQFICLFALISIPNYPELLNIIYNAQFPWNLNFIYYFQFNLSICNALKSDEKLEGNYMNHPSLLQISFICNAFPILVDLSIIVALYFLSLLIYIKLMNNILISSSKLNEFLNFVQGCLIVFMVILYIQIIYVH